MSVSILDQMTHTASGSPTNLVISSGANRLAFLVTTGAGGASASGRSGVTAGGVAMTLVAELASSPKLFIQFWVLTEAEIATMTGTDVSISGGNTPGGSSVVQWTVQNAAQSGWDTANAYIYSSSVSASLQRQNSSLTIAVAAVVYKYGGGATLTNPAHSGSYIAGDYYAVGYGSQDDSLGLSDVTNPAPTASRNRGIVAINIPSIIPANNVDNDNDIDQFQRTVALNHSLASPLTSVLINNVEHIDLIQNSDAELKYIKRCYDAIGSDVTSVILKNGVDTDVTIPSVTVNTTHPYPVPNEAVDSNSMFSGVTVSGNNAAFRITSAPTKGTLDLSDPAKYLHDVDASKGGVYTPNAGATGTDSFTFEVHDPDEPVALNRTQSGTVTINIAELGLPISGSAAFSFPNFQFPILDTTH